MNKKSIISGVVSAAMIMGLTACTSSTPPAIDPVPGPGTYSGEGGIIPTDDVCVVDPGKMNATYQNPVIDMGHDRIWSDYGVGDPFVMRYNGIYYLYNSTKDGKTGIQCWTSEDLVNWTYGGFCAKEFMTLTAYAPEVTYYNGKFYMCTSPAGQGHYILESDSPTGPFVAVTDNFGLSIDGNIFIDDNGDWYFTSASNGGIMAYRMLSPTQVDASSGFQTGLVVQAGEGQPAWTEGSMLIKYGDTYYMTYCGNHVWSLGYRIDYGAGDSPLTMKKADNTPLLINTNKKEVSGIGHSSTVLGPNLDSMYIVYHSSSRAPEREMNIAPLMLNGTYMQALGPTITKQQSPEMPDVYSRFDTEESLNGWISQDALISDGSLLISEGGSVLSSEKFEGNYTAEFNFLTITGKAGALFGYTDENNYGAAYICTETDTLEIRFTVNGEEVVYSVPLDASFGEKYRYDVLQQLTLRKAGDTYTFLVNNRTVGEYTSSLGGGAIGIASEKGEMRMGYVGAEGNAWLSSMKDYFKPIDGELQAITCMEEDLALVEHNGTNYVQIKKGETYNYKVNVKESSSYDLAIRYRASADTRFELYCGGTLLMSGTLAASDENDTTAVFRDIELPAGEGALTFRFTDGAADVFNYTFSDHVDTESQTLDLNSPIYSEGEYSIDADTGAFSAPVYGKYLWGDYDLGDYTAHFTLASENNLLTYLFVRASQPAIGGAGNDVNAGANFYIGYNVKVSQRNGVVTVSLYECRYSPSKIEEKEISVTDETEALDFKIEAHGATIRVWFGEECLIEYTDDTPILNGTVGIRGTKVSGIKIER